MMNSRRLFGRVGAFCIPRASYKSNARSRSYQHNKYGASNNNLPDFQSLIRQLYKRSHPDILRASHPASAEVNEASMQILNGILSTIKTYDSPAAINKRLVFHIKNNTTGKMEEKCLNIRTTGGSCKSNLTKTFETFFTDCDIGNKFQWNKEYFPVMSLEEYNKLKEAHAKENANE